MNELMPMAIPPAWSPEKERIPVMQRLLDNPFLLLFLGVTIPTVFYVMWGIMESCPSPFLPTSNNTGGN
jgi:hypothetical protein